MCDVTLCYQNHDFHCRLIRLLWCHRIAPRVFCVGLLADAQVRRYPRYEAVTLHPAFVVKDISVGVDVVQDTAIEAQHTQAGSLKNAIHALTVSHWKNLRYRLPVTSYRYRHTNA